MTRRKWQQLVPMTVTFITVAILLIAAGGRENRDNWQQPARVIADLGLKPGDTVADIGCGRGYFTFPLSKAIGRAGKVYAVDIDAKALKAVADRAEKERLGNIQTVLSEPADTKLTSASLDAAVLIDVLHHVAKDKRLPLVEDIVRALKPGGFLFIIDWRVDAEIDHDRGNRIPKEELLKLAADSGLTLDAEFFYLKHQVFLRCRKMSKSE